MTQYLIYHIQICRYDLMIKSMRKFRMLFGLDEKTNIFLLSIGYSFNRSDYFQVQNDNTFASLQHFRDG